MITRAAKLLLLLMLIAFPVYSQSNIEGTSAPSFTLENTDGKRVNLQDYLAKGPVLLDFWATWCAPCKQAMPHLNKLHESYNDKGFTVLAISVDNTRSVSKVKPFVKSQRYSFPVLLDTDQEVLKRYRGNNVPHTVLISTEGKIQKVWIGYHPGEEKEIEAEVLTLLKSANADEE
ncbi:TlpA family protein disulfide reductase [bacterium]|nr:TlpA family protein disulfide reductase [bacterium]